MQNFWMCVYTYIILRERASLHQIFKKVCDIKTYSYSYSKNYHIRYNSEVIFLLSLMMTCMVGQNEEC